MDLSLIDDLQKISFRLCFDSVYVHFVPNKLLLNKVRGQPFMRRCGGLGCRAPAASTLDRCCPSKVPPLLPYSHFFALSFIFDPPPSAHETPSY